MAKFAEHCADCVEQLGEPFEEVHLWLDDIFKVMGPKHRSARHNTAGVEAVRSMYGDRAALAAEIHIKKDYYSKSVPSLSQS